MTQMVPVHMCFWVHGALVGPGDFGSEPQDRDGSGGPGAVSLEPAGDK